MKRIATSVALTIGALAFSQVGINTQTPKVTLDVVGEPTEASVLDGIRAPRITGALLGEKTYTTNQTGALVFVTEGDPVPEGQTEEVTSIGYYYFDGTKWVKLNAGAAGQEPWFNQDTNTEATANTQNIYQMGSVAIGKDEATAGVALDIAGAVRGGSGHIGAVGENSASFGWRATASGRAAFASGYESNAAGWQSTAIGFQTTASGNTSTAMGSTTTASGDISTAMGQGTIASSDMSTAMGSHTTASGNSSIAMGFVTTASSKAETVIGMYNAIRTGKEYDPYGYVETDALFQIGNGKGLSSFGTDRNNAVTVLKNAHTAIGIVGEEADAKPTELLDLGGEATAGKGGLKIRNINSAAYTGNAATDKIVVADATGVLKTIAPSSMSNNSWYNVDTNAPATANTQNIYQMGKVGVMTDDPTGLFHAYNNSDTTNPFTVESDNAGPNQGNDAYFYGYGSSITPGLFFLSARGTKAAPINLNVGDLMGEYNFGGYINSVWNYSLASVRGSYDGDGTTLDSSLKFVTSSQTNMIIAANGDVGFGENTPKAKVHVQSGDVYIEQVGSGVIMKSPNGNCWRVTVSDTGAFNSAATTCP